uniref:RRM domain-containing protein n=1 Tax=Aegilops tauschii subsp. strangulata TaxID=200361 RepID=A0A453HSZ9_AEGTS
MPSEQPLTSLRLSSPSPKVSLQCPVYFAQELFSEMGEIQRYSINYDKSGRSKGTAEVVFSARSSAVAALKKYNNVHLDGKPMKIEVIGTNIEAPAPIPAIFALAPPPGNFSFPSKRFVASTPGAMQKLFIL